MRTSTWPATSATHGTQLIIQLSWYMAGLVVAFLVPFVFSSGLDLENDAYYLIYFVSAVAFAGVYALSTHLDVRALFTRRWRWSAGLGVVAAVFVVSSVLSREDATPRPDGWYLAFEVAWRGLVYGLVDALLLSAFPVAVAWALHGGRLGTAARRATFVGASVALVVAITAVYHVGFEQYREDGVGAPELGNTVISLPAILTANPLGSFAAHASMHMTAVLHSYETEVYLPPPKAAD